MFERETSSILTLVINLSFSYQPFYVLRASPIAALFFFIRVNFAGVVIRSNVSEIPDQVKQLGEKTFLEGPVLKKVFTAVCVKRGEGQTTRNPTPLAVARHACHARRGHAPRGNIVYPHDNGVGNSRRPVTGRRAFSRRISVIRVAELNAASVRLRRLVGAIFEIKEELSRAAAT